MSVRLLSVCVSVWLLGAVSSRAQQQPAAAATGESSDAWAERDFEAPPEANTGAQVAAASGTDDAWAAGGFEAAPEAEGAADVQTASGHAGAADSGASESELTSRGEIVVEARGFLDDSDPGTRDAEFGLASRLEIEHKHGRFEERVRLLGRMDSLNRRRSVFLPEDIWAQARFGLLRVRAGAELINWSATEAFHPADVLNARNFDSDIQNFEKRGEPMLDLQLGPLRSTTLKLLVMPFRTQPFFPPPNSRMSFAPGISFGDDLRVDRAGHFSNSDWGPQAALELEQVIGSADISLHVLEHMDRSQPVVGVDLQHNRPARLYQTVRQLGLTYQQVFGPLIVKVEGVYRWFQRPDSLTGRFAPFSLEGQPVPSSQLPDRDHAAGAIGLEYGVVHDSGAQSTFVLEGTALIGPDKPTRIQLTVFQRDVLVGYRLDLGDEQARNLFVGFIFDLERWGETLTTVECSQRLGEAWSARLRARVFTGERDLFGLGVLRKADSLQVLVTRHF